MPDLTECAGRCSKDHECHKEITRYETGATRDSRKGKPDYAGFYSFRVMKRFGQYMMEHQKQADGSLRASDNWKKGMPLADYKESAYRHTVDFLYLLETNTGTDKEREDLLCAIMFNWQGYLHEHLIDREEIESVFEFNTGISIEEEKLMEE